MGSKVSGTDFLNLHIKNIFKTVDFGSKPNARIMKFFSFVTMLRPHSDNARIFMNRGRVSFRITYFYFPIVILPLITNFIFFNLIIFNMIIIMIRTYHNYRKNLYVYTYELSVRHAETGRYIFLNRVQR